MSAKIEIPSFELSDGSKMPMIGLGTYDSTDEAELSTAIKSAIYAGYRHIDCALFYQNESIIGKAIHEKIAESNGKLRREDFFVVSKCWNNFHSAAGVNECLEKILNSFKFDYIDLYLVHWPMGFEVNINIAKAIWISNNFNHLK